MEVGLPNAKARAAGLTANVNDRGVVVLFKSNRKNRKKGVVSKQKLKIPGR
jgi:hypothetical protein